MSSRALSLATMLVIVVLAGGVARAQNLEAGKSAAQIFSGNCAACHKGVRGLVRTVPPGSLPGFLRQHYTTGPTMAGMLSAYLMSRGATDQRYRVERPRSHPGGMISEPRQAGRRGGKPIPQAAQPDPAAQNEVQAGKDRYGRRIVGPAAESPETARPASEEASEHDRRKLRDRKKLSKQRKPASEESAKAGAAGQGKSPHDAATKPEAVKIDDVTPAKDPVLETESAKEQADVKQPAPEQAPKPQAVKPDTPKADSARSGSDKTGRSKPDEPGVDKLEARESTSQNSKAGSTSPDAVPTSEPKAVPLRADPVPAVTPAPKVGEADARSPLEAGSSTPASASTDSAAAPSKKTSPEMEPAPPPLEPAASSAPPPAPDR
ncbi:hypothetical protein [Nitrobacter sp. Nb-311A]|uniref:hypothetical protein n=1 Tax=Nitrobacter sp. Nb-311A TaxID=314253 RepID=UPI00031CE151|nr:hypothetical protein [Nitrobacter sp. Nb-311A]